MEGRGLWITVNRSSARRDATAIDADHVYVRIRLNFHSGYYRIVWAFGENPRVEKSTNMTTWTRVGDIPVADGGATATGGAAELRFLVLWVNGRLSFRATPSNSWNEKGLVVPLLGEFLQLVTTGKNCNASINHSPALFPSDGSLKSATRQKNWYNVATPISRSQTTDVAAGDPGDPGTVKFETVDTGDDFTAQYLMSLYATADNKQSPNARFAVTKWPCQMVPPSLSPDWRLIETTMPYPEGYPEGFELQQILDTQGMTVLRSGSVTCRNTEGQYAQDYGARAVMVVAGLDVYFEDGTIENLWLGVRFVGWLGLDTETTTEQWMGSLTDRTEYELMVPLEAEITLDGDCCYHALKTLYERGGFTPEWYAASNPGAPADAWTCDGVTCNPEAGHYRLPSGTGAAPVLDYDADALIWQVMQDVRAKMQLFIGVTSDGYAQMWPWEPWNARNDWTPDAIFTTVPAFTAGRPVLNELIGSLVKHCSRRNLRNSVTLIGLDKDTWRPFAAHRANQRSICNASSHTPPPDFVGRVRGYCESNARYADPYFTDYAADRKAAVMMCPEQGFRPLQCWPQPLFPLNYVGVAANKAVALDDRYYVGAISERIFVEGEGEHASAKYEMYLSPDLVPYGLTFASGDELAYAVNAASYNGSPASYAIADQSAEGVGLAA
jgi:hypothetical protein